MKFTHSDLLVALVARVLGSIAERKLDGEGVRANADINIGLAMAVDEGVVAPVIRDADKIHSTKSPRTSRPDDARAVGKLRPADLGRHVHHQQSWNVWSRRLHGDHHSAAGCDPGGRRDRGSSRCGRRRPGVCPMMTLTLSSDHRVVDGARSAEFMSSLAEPLQVSVRLFDRRSQYG